jgi:hypothetical protein
MIITDPNPNFRAMGKSITAPKRKINSQMSHLKVNAVKQGGKGEVVGEHCLILMGKNSKIWFFANCRTG